MILEEKVRRLRQEVAEKCCEIEDICQEWGLSKITAITVIARDPQNENMVIVVTNDEQGLKSAFDAALKAEKPMS